MTFDADDLTLQDVLSARKRIASLAIETPLVALQDDGATDVHLKLECLQPVGSFKVRCAANALLHRERAVREGATTASAGNFAQGLAFAGRALGIPVSTYVPVTAAQTKVEALERLGARVMPIAFDQWWAMLVDPPNDPSFIHPVIDPDVLAGNGVIALELLDLQPALATVMAPYGGGGLAVGVALALKASGSPAAVIACETEAGAPLAAARAADRPVPVDFDPTTFVTGMGGPIVLPPMWPLVRRLIAGTALVSLKQTADAIRLLVHRHHVVAEGAGAAPVAAALAERRAGVTACIVSGGHLDTHHLVTILNGGTP